LGCSKSLLVEDDDDTRDVLVDALYEHGLEARPCSSGEEALALLRGHDFDSLITDQSMPE